MPLRQTIFIVLAVLAFLLAFIYFDMVTSVVPGWHTTIYAGASWHQYLFPVVLFGIAVLYRRIAKRGIFVSRAFFITHLLFTVIVYIVAISEQRCISGFCCLPGSITIISRGFFSWLWLPIGRSGS
jgi:hypothetical protein